jgi:signal transduction histidine kinase
VAIYRIVQEALTNVVKHAGARHVWISIADPEDDDGPVCVEIRDDGHGFESARADRGFGLVGMRERIALVHGELEVTSVPEEGTRVVARIPLERRPAGAAHSVTPAT